MTWRSVRRLLWHSLDWWFAHSTEVVAEGVAGTLTECSGRRALFMGRRPEGREWRSMQTGSSREESDWRVCRTLTEQKRLIGWGGCRAPSEWSQAQYCNSEYTVQWIVLTTFSRLRPLWKRLQVQYRNLASFMATVRPDQRTGQPAHNVWERTQNVRLKENLKIKETIYFLDVDFEMISRSIYLEVLTN